MPDNPFIGGKIYKRSAIHDEFGGNRQSGISNSIKRPYIFIFSVQSKNRHLYLDRWENNDIFSYTGEGQKGDMHFTRGNLELRDHKKNNKRVFLFIQTQKAFVTFDSELEIVDFDFYESLDWNGNNRETIKFFFKRVGSTLNYEYENNIIVQEPEYQYKSLKIPNETERKGLVTSRIGQGAYRKSVLFRWEFKCAVTNYEKPEVLIASHIVPWKDATDEERLDVNNGILLSPNYDALFDSHLISFEPNGKIVLTKNLSISNYRLLGIDGKEIIRNLSEGNKKYLETHRKSAEINNGFKF
jgi:predicted restriction endonuclease